MGDAGIQHSHGGANGVGTSHSQNGVNNDADFRFHDGENVAVVFHYHDETSDCHTGVAFDCHDVSGMTWLTRFLIRSYVRMCSFKLEPQGYVQTVSFSFENKSICASSLIF